MLIALNQDIAGRLDEVSRILAEQGASRFRVQAYQHAASAVRELSCPVSEIFAKEGIDGLEKILEWVKPSRAQSGISCCTENWPCWSGCGVNTIP